MRATVLFALLGVLSTAQAGEPAKDPAAVKLLRRAVEAQGKLPEGGLQDIQITFEGQIREPDQGEHSITRRYWFRVRDRSFRIRTYANVDEARTRSERGVLGKDGGRFWEWSRGARVRLKPTNREHRKNVEAIRRDREDFERIVRMVVLARAEEKLTRIRLGDPARATCENDVPNSRRYVFPAAHAGTSYLALDLQRDGADPLRLFVHEKDLTVRKVVQFDRSDPGAVRFVYYLGYYRKKGDLLLPGYVSVHTEVPSESTRVKSTRLAGRITMAVNAGLADDVFSPTGASDGADDDPRDSAKKGSEAKE